VEGRLLRRTYHRHRAARSGYEVRHSRLQDSTKTARFACHGRFVEQGREIEACRITCMPFEAAHRINASPKLTDRGPCWPMASSRNFSTNADCRCKRHRLMMAWSSPSINRSSKRPRKGAQVPNLKSCSLMSHSAWVVKHGSGPSVPLLKTTSNDNGQRTGASKSNQSQGPSRRYGPARRRALS